MELAKLNGTVIDLNYAEEIVKKNKVKNQYNEYEFFEGLTTSKLRGLLGMVNNIYTKVYSSPALELSPSIKDDLEYLKVKFAYEAGKEKSVKNFINETKTRELLNIVIKKGTKEYFLNYCKYFEALVAYTKFYGMGD